METRLIDEMLDALCNYVTFFGENPDAIECSPNAILKFIEESTTITPKIPYRPEDGVVAALHGLPVLVNKDLEGDRVLFTTKRPIDSLFDDFKPIYPLAFVNVNENFAEKDISNDSFINILNGGDHKVTS